MPIGYESRRRGRLRRTSSDYYHDRRQRRERANGRSDFEQAFSSESLFRAFQDLRTTAGPAPGIDQIHFGDLSPREVGQIVGVISDSILDGSYRPHPTRRQLIAKPGREEMRVLRIGTIFDRLVARTLADYLQPHWERRFLDESWGFRPGRGVLEMLSRLVATIEVQGLWVIASDDIRQAFDHVRISDVLRAHEQSGIDDDRLLGLIERVLQGSMADRKVGIDQGSPFSPMALNAVLHFAHDVPLDEAVTKPRSFRYADNVVYPTGRVSEGRQTLARVRNLLRRVGLTLKGECGPADLSRGAEIPILGLVLSAREGRIRIDPDPKSWPDLQTRLREAHTHPDALGKARAIIRGWVDIVGMALESGESARQILDLAADAGYREIGSAAEVAEWIEAARDRWQRWVEASRYVIAVSDP